LPPEARGLLLALEMYATADSPPPDVLVKTTLTPAGVARGRRRRAAAAAGRCAPREAAVTLPRSNAWVARGSRCVLVAEAEFPLDRSPAGPYAIAATVLSGNVVLVSVTSTVTR
jgi:hypothetical protein